MPSELLTTSTSKILKGWSIRRRIAVVQVCQSAYELAIVAIINR